MLKGGNVGKRVRGIPKMRMIDDLSEYGTSEGLKRRAERRELE